MKMIPVNELRINDWVDCLLLGKYQLKSGDIEKDKAKEIYKPIPLTPEILLACGFKKTVRGKETDFDGEEIVYFKEGVDIYDHTENGGGFAYATYTRYPGRGFKGGILVSSLHHLQNLYWCLTNSELEYKP